MSDGQTLQLNSETSNSEVRAIELNRPRRFGEPRLPEPTSRRKMKNRISPSGICIPRALAGLALSSAGVLLAMLSFAAKPAISANLSGAAADWSIVASPNVSEADKNNSLVATTCVSASDCWAVGSSQTLELAGSAAQTLTERWDGSSWTIVPSPNTDAKQSNSLTGVTCVSASDCWAVGS